MAIPRNAFVRLAKAILSEGAKKATKYISQNEVITATQWAKSRKSGHAARILFTVGRPNYEERKFIAKCKQAGEPFPVKKIQMKFAPVR